MKLLDLDRLAPAYAAGEKAAKLLLNELGLDGKPPSGENSEKAFNALAYTCFAVLAKTSADPSSETKAFAKQLPTMLTRMSALLHRGPKH